MSYTSMFSDIWHMAAWLGLGTLGTMAFAALAFFFPRYAFYMLIAAVLSGAATFIYAKGAYDDFYVQKRLQDEAAKAAVEKFAKERTAAERTVHDQRAKPTGGVRDIYDRDQLANKPVANPKASVRPVAPPNVLRK